MRPLILIGPMGVGKTTLGRKIASKNGLKFCDTDKLVERDNGEIPRIFESLGESGFRDLEHKALADAISNYQVIATGGGVVTNDANHELLKKGFVVYLSTTGKHMRARLVAGNRPLLKNGFSDWREIYERRKPLYEQLADVEFSITGISLRNLANNVYQAYQEEENAGL